MLALNHKRANWGRRALDAFRRQVGGDDDGTLILDLITDLGHLARQRQLHFVALVARAVSVWLAEVKAPEGVDPGPQVSIRVERRRPVYAYRRRGRPGAPSPFNTDNVRRAPS
jgi:hypothetical protein